MPMNKHGQPVGSPLAAWSPPSWPQHGVLAGRFVTLEPWAPHHAEGLAEAFEGAPETLWTYLPYGPLAWADHFDALREQLEAAEMQCYVAVVTGEPATVGFLCHLRIQPREGSIEVGAVTFSPHLQRTVAATEAQYLLMKHAFEAGFRRYEWKCDDLNAPSRAAARRLGFVYEGTFRQATHYKGRSRDTAWFSILDREWPDVAGRFEQWLAPSNFDEAGAQLRPLHAEA